MNADGTLKKTPGPQKSKDDLKGSYNMATAVQRNKLKRASGNFHEIRKTTNLKGTDSS